MFNDKRILAIIPAREGSKGIVNKNIIDLNNKPLIAYSIEAAKESDYIDDVIVSTDGEEIKSISLKYGAEVPFFRPKSLATDKSKTIDSIIYTINRLRDMGREYDVLILLQPTSPMRTVKHIDESLSLFFKNNQESLVSVNQIDISPILVRTIKNGKLFSILNQNSTVRRQDMDFYYKINGAIYINRIDEVDENLSFNDNSIPYIMDDTYSIDIDTIEDLQLARQKLKSL